VIDVVTPAAVRLLPAPRIAPFFLLPYLFFFLIAGLDRIGAQEKSGSLLPRTPAFFTLAAGDSLTLTFDATAGHEAEILVEASASGVEFSVFSPGGQQLSADRAELPQWLALSFPCAELGQYRLVARTKSTGDGIEGASFRAVFLTFPVAGVKELRRAETIFAVARSLASSPQQAPVRASIARFRQAGEAWAAAGDREGEVLALAGEAQAWLDLSDYPATLAALDRARILSAQMPFFRAWLANLQAQLYLEREDSKPAGRYADEAVRQSRALNDEWLTADSLADRAESEYWTHAPAEHGDIEEAIQLSSHAHAVETLARALRCSAWIEQDEHNMTHALGLLQRAEDLFQRAGDSRDAAIGMSDMANNQQFSGDPYVALVRQSSLIPLLRESGKLTYLEFLLTDIADDYGALNKVPDAIAYTGQALQIANKIEGRSRETRASYELSQLCEFQMRMGRLHEALGNCQKSIALIEPIHNPIWTANAIRRLGNVQHALGQKEQAIASFRRASALSRSAQDTGLEARSLMDWGAVLENLGRREEARSLFEKALPLSQSAADPEVEIEARYRIAQSESEAGRNDDAKRDLRIALDSIEAQRRAVGNADLQAAYFAHVRKCHELFVEVLMREHERNRDLPSDMLALEISESARARTLLDSLKARDLDQPLNQSEDPSAERIKLRIAVEQAYDQRLKLMLEGNHKRELQENSAMLTQAIDSMQRMEDFDRDNEKAIPRSGRPLSAQDILQASKTSPATLLEYALGAEQSYLWVVHSGTINSYVLKARQEEIEGLIGRWRKLATIQVPREGDDAERELQGVAAKLSCLLLNNYIGPQDKKLAIVADGELAALPFVSLPLNGCDARPGPPVITAHQVVMIPSLSIFLTHPVRDAQTGFSKEVAIVANPVFDPGDDRVHIKQSDLRHGPLSAAQERIKDMPALPRLVGTGEEAIEIQQTVGPEKASVFLGFNASVETILGPEMRNYRILHLATHGISDETTPGFSGLVLSLVSPDGHPVFGYLKTHDIANLDLHPELVVLSACDSGTGNNLSGEGVTGLAYAFLHAGARQVASTLWDVDDEVTKDLMINFYKEMYSAGLDPAEALRQSQISMMQSPHRSAPYYWAGFEITSIGN
jgi:CHAT domain-containing protein